MAVRLNFLRLELKRAWKRLPYMAMGAIVLMFMLGTIAFAAGKILQGEEALGRITVGVVLPKEDKRAELVVQMLGSLDSVGSLCDFLYLEEEEAKRALETGEISGVMKVPEGMVEGIMDGTNPPVYVLLPENRLESIVFRELTMAGARTLSAAQAGIYGGDELLKITGKEELIPVLEEELNRIYLAYSLPRANYFRQKQVIVSGEVSPFAFYGISAFVLYLLLEVIPAAGYLSGESRVLDRKLNILGIGRVQMIFARVIGLGTLLFAAGLLCGAGLFFGGKVLGADFLEFSPIWLPALGLMCLLAASMALFFFECAGTLLGGVMLLSAASMVFLLFSGGLVPDILLPEGIRKISGWMPLAPMLECGKGAVLGSLSLKAVLGTGLYGVVFVMLAAGVRRR